MEEGPEGREGLLEAGGGEVEDRGMTAEEEEGEDSEGHSGIQNIRVFEQVTKAVTFLLLQSMLSYGKVVSFDSFVA